MLSHQRFPKDAYREWYELRSKERSMGKDGKRKAEGREYEEKEKERTSEERKNQSAYMEKKGKERREMKGK